MPSARGKSLAGIGVELPAVVRMSKDREAKVELRIRNERQQKKNLRLALAWPREIKAAEEDMDAALPADSEWSRLALACTPLLRGRLQVEFGVCRRRFAAGFLGGRAKRFPCSRKFAFIPIC